jgi:formylglycine-generating enzyme required for sulfatase activity
MKSFPSSKLSLAILAGISLVTPSFAVINIDYVPVGNAGNAADNSTGSLYGAVAYAYQIGKYEVTNAQYTAFLNAVDPTGANANGIYNTSMGSDIRGGITYTAGATSGAKYTIRTSMGDKPVNYVSWYDSARFTNWLHNGQGAGGTETGAYTLSGNTGVITKNVGATVWLPSENEWYKAAYYDPTPGASGNNYWLYPTQSDTVPTVGTANITGDISNPDANVANYFFGANWNAQNGNVTTVGSAVANNYFGTADQGGNVWEWNDAVISGFARGLRGGSWNSGGELNLRASLRSSFGPASEDFVVGFRVATVPEPTSLVLTILASGVILLRRKRA